MTDWNGLHTAFASSGTVTLGADITAPSGSNLVETAATTVILDLNGYSLIIATPPTGAAAIQDTAATLTIEDPTGAGVLTAIGSGGGNGGAGIGGSPGNGVGSAANAGNVTITGGTVNATAGGAGDGAFRGGAGIGGGGYDVDSGTVTITGGTVSAYGNAAGIGGGAEAPGAVVMISGGKVTASGTTGAGIGSGPVNCGSTISAGTVTITGGMVNASGYGAGIGGGSCADGGDVSIGSGAVVETDSIGSGGAGDTVFGSLSNSGNLTLDFSEAVPPTVTASNGAFTNNAGGVITLDSTLGGGGTVVNNGTILTGSGGSVASDGTTVTEHDYPVTYNLNGRSGTAPTPQTVYAASFDDATLTLPALPTGEEWSDAASGGTTVTDATDLTGLFGESTTGATPVTLYVTAVPETVAFNPENGQASTTETIPYGSDATQPADPSRTGSVFDGWFTAPTGGSLYDFSTPVTSSFTLYAQWALPTVPVTVTGSQTYGGTASFTSTPTAALPAGVSLSGSTTCTTVNGGSSITPTLTAGGAFTIDRASCSGLSLAGPNAANYVLSLTGSTFTVTPAPLTITAANASRFFGQPNPAFSVSYHGLVNNDSPASLHGTLTVTTATTPASPPGGYAIVASGLSSPDYTITYRNGTLTVTKAPTATTVTVTPATPTLGGLVTFTATVATAQVNDSGVHPTGTVAFYIDGAANPAATMNLAAAGTAVFQATLSGGTTMVSAAYSGDGNFLGSSTTAPANATIACAATITGTHSGAVIAAKGLTCIEDAQQTGSVTVDAGASLDVENSTLSGAIVANGATSIRICATTTGSLGSINILGSTGFVLVGDPGEDGCAANVIGGSLNLTNNTGGLVAVDNTITGALNAAGNSGAVPFPDQTAPDISGNHH